MVDQASSGGGGSRALLPIQARILCKLYTDNNGGVRKKRKRNKLLKANAGKIDPKGDVSTGVQSAEDSSLPKPAKRKPVTDSGNSGSDEPAADTILRRLGALKDLRPPECRGLKYSWAPTVPEDAAATRATGAGGAADDMAEIDDIKKYEKSRGAGGSKNAGGSGENVTIVIQFVDYQLYDAQTTVASVLHNKVLTA